MNTTVRPAAERGVANFGWLHSHHTFSFGQYYDPQFMGFGPLRVINEDRVAPSGGFDTHGHQDMEIVTYVLSGALEHRDSLGNGSIIRPGDVQRMTAGTGIRHSEFNASNSEPVHLLQIWIRPAELGLRPSYEQRFFPLDTRHGQLRLIGSADGRDGSVLIHQDVNLYATVLAQAETVTLNTQANRKLWVQVAQGALQVNEQTLQAGDGFSLSGAETLSLTGTAPHSEALIFDMG
ncbi:MAG: pirin family protein [Gloeomargaritaceae cyanobacterium C42_A2020_066]|nr:pirin family protein [Gloeomargaritaceae cyanobacterium C42_A2020_066]